MTLNSRLNIIGKVGIDGGFGILRQQSKTFRDRPANWFSRANHGHGLRVLFNHDFGACPDSSQERSKIAGRFNFRDVNNRLGHGDTD